MVGASKLQDQEQQPEQEQKGTKTWPKASVSSLYLGVSEGTLGILWALFWAFPVLHCPCVSLCGRDVFVGCVWWSVRQSCRIQQQQQQQHQQQLQLGTFLWGVSGGRCVGAEDQEQQPEQEQKEVKTLPKALISSFYIGDHKGR